MTKSRFFRRISSGAALCAAAFAFACNRAPSAPSEGTAAVERAALSNEGLVAAYAFDEGSGSDVHDSSGSALDTSLTSETWVSGRFGGALHFDGETLTVPDSPLFDIEDELTLSAWVLPDVVSGHEWATVLMRMSDTEVDFAYGLFTDRNEVGPSILIGTDEWWDAAPFRALPPSRWSHLAGTYDGSELKLYVNATLVGTRPVEGPLRDVDGPLAIGGNSIWGEFFRGRIDELRIYERALSESEIGELMLTPIVPGAASDSTPPTVSITAPSAGASVSGIVSLTATASDAGEISSVEFLVDGEVLGGEDDAAPYERAWLANAATAGTHELRARATDVAGNVALSEPVSVTVSGGSNHPGLLAAFGFDEGSGTETHDVSGANQHATLSAQSWVAGRYGSALEYSGTPLEVPASEVLRLGGQMTLSAWVLPTEGGDFPTVIAQGEDWWFPNYELRGPGYHEILGAFRTATGGQGRTGGEPLGLGFWRHIATTYDGTTLRNYVNGDLVDEGGAGGTILYDAAPLHLGARSNGDAPYHGRIDEVRIYNRALAESEIESDMATPLTSGALADTLPPEVLLTSPAPGSSAVGMVTLAASATDASGVWRVRFLIDGVQLGQPVTGGPFTKQWYANAATPGTHVLSAEAMDGSGNVALSPPVTVVVDEGLGIEGLVAAYGFDEGTGTSVHDVSGAGHDTELDGQSWVQGKFGHALEFDDDFLTVAHSDLLALGESATLSAWVQRRPGARDHWQAVLGKFGEQGFSYALYGVTDWERPRGIFPLEDYGEAIGEVPITPHSWTHLATTYDGSQVVLYVNGEEVAANEASGALPFTDGPLMIGSLERWNPDRFFGRIDEVRIYDRALAPAEVVAMMNQPLTPGAEPDELAPDVELTSPPDESDAAGMLTLAAEAADPSGIAQVKFLLDGRPIGFPLIEPPYEKTWLASSWPPGTHEIQAEATDGSGNVALSSSHSITVPNDAIPGLIAAYGFDEGEGTETFDATAAGHDTELTGQEWVSGKYGSALRFNENYLLVPHSELLDLQTEMTLSAWVLPEAEPVGYPMIVSSGSEDWAPNYCLRGASSWQESSGGIRTIYDGWGIGAGGLDPLPHGSWRHLAITYDGHQVRLYVNGTLIQESEGDAEGTLIRTSGSDLKIGGTGAWDQFYRGRIDELRIYNRGLSAAEIALDMATPVTSGATGDSTPPTVAVTAPAAGSTAAGLVTLSATASDASGIRHVRYLIDGVPLGSAVGEAPYTKQWHATSATPGTHTITAEATDSAGNVAVSAPIEVTVEEGAGVSGLVAAYSFDEGSGEAVHDVTGAGHDTVLDGQAWTQGKFGNALDFDANFLTVEGTEFLDLGSEMTLSAWVLPHDVNREWQAVLSRGADWDVSYSLYAVANYWRPRTLVSSQSEYAEAVSDVTIENFSWVHLAATLKDDELSLYVNGELTATAPFVGPLRDVDGPLWIGSSAPWGNDFNGRIDEVRIYNRALAPSEIEAVMNQPLDANATADTTPPEVVMTSPESGSASGLVSLAATASDPSGISMVRFLVDGVQFGTSMDVPPFAKGWLPKALPAGDHEIRAEATDGAGNVALSAPVTVTVDEEVSVPGLVAAYGFDEGSGDETADASGAENHATLAGQTWVNGRFGSALDFDHTSITVPHSDLLDLGPGMTLSAWVLPNGEPMPNPIILFSGSDWWFADYYLRGNGWAEGFAGLRTVSNDGFNVGGGWLIPMGEWRHLAATYDGEFVRMYVNGSVVHEVEGSGPIHASDSPLSIGGLGNTDFSYGGRIDEIRIYNRALSESEIGVIMQTPVTAGATADVIPPVVSLVSPEAGGSLPGDTRVTLSATATDASGIRQVRFAVDETAIGEPDTSAPYELSWLPRTVAPGEHLLRAEATDIAGNVAVSEPVAVTVVAGEFRWGLVGAWGFEEGSGSTTHEQSGTGQDGELDGQAWVSGKFGQSLDFDGAVLSIAQSELQALTTGMTLSAWVMPERAERGWKSLLVRSRDWETAYKLHLSSDNDAPAGEFVGTYGHAVRTDTRAAPRTWSYIATTYDGSSLKLYVNGELVGEEDADGEEIRRVDGAGLFFGGHSAWVNEIFDGRMDEVRIYDRALSQLEVQEDMASPVVEGLVADTTPPSVALSSPSSGATVSGIVLLTASVSDAGDIGMVEFLVDGESIGSPDIEAPYQRGWSSGTIPAGEHVLTARATDLSGNVATSAPVTVTVELDPTGALVAAYGFDEGSGTDVYDATGYGHDSELSGQDWAEGKFGTALEFSGSGFSVADSDLLDLSQGMTLSAWVRRQADLPNWPTVMLKEAQGRLAYALYAGTPDGGPPATYIGRGSDELGIWGDETLELDAWTYLTATYDSTTLRLYVNAELVEETEVGGGIITSDGPLSFGANGVWDGELFYGRIDEARVYARALAPAEIAADMDTPVNASGGPDLTPPLVSVTAPSAGTSVFGNVLVRASAYDASGVESVQFLLDDAPLGDLIEASPYEYDWATSSVSLGAHVLKARATDAAGNVATSSGVSVTVTGVCNPATVTDGNPCTTDTCSASGTPVYTPVAPGTSCSDGNRCNGAEACNATAECVSGPAPSTDASCDGVDDDCDGQTDEDFASQPTSCGVGACARTGASACQGGQVVTGCTPGTAAANDALCNGVDDDCNGQIDEDFTSVATNCGVGACARTGFTSCIDGVPGNSCVAGTAAADDATCNGVDDDCSGQTDEDYVATITTCGVGACGRNGTTACVSGLVTNSCTPGTPAANDSTCNGVDDDCDGQKDEDYAPVATTCGSSACSATGSTSCVNGSVTNSCTPGSPASSDDTCDGVDNDCDGTPDDGWVSAPTSCGVGACAATGVTTCGGGVPGNTCSAGDPADDDSTCDGVDDDCDGEIDEDYAPAVTHCGVGACAADGITSCVNGAVSNSCSEGTAATSDATCNGIDDDCDGQKDEDYAPASTSCGVGACGRTGATSCVNGSVTNSCSPGTPAASDATCNGVDDDCSGQVDEDFASTSTSCGVGACGRTGATSCVAGEVVNGCTAGTPAASDTTCNGVDEDCNGQADEDYVSLPTTCGSSSCAATGATSCVNGEVLNSCTPGNPASNDATCDGIDNDCDGDIDEGYTPVPTTCGVGACASTGANTCVSGGLVNTCAAGTAATSDANCNGIDDDCDGQVDEDYVPVAVSCGVGACAATGVTSCESGAVVPHCTAGTAATSDATCNGIDDDCDGTKDEDYVSVATSCGAGICARTGATSCAGGSVSNSCTPGTPGASDNTCDGIDNDCDGQTDEGFVPEPTTCGVGACAATGTTSCTNGVPGNSCSPGTAATSDTTCNGVDDDCDGTKDEDYVSTPTTCGQGACASTGATSCVNGAVSNSCTEGTPAASDDTCDGIDNDCDGPADEDFVEDITSCGRGVCASTGVTSCVDGEIEDDCVEGPRESDTDAQCDSRDQDCDGAVDEDYASTPTSCGLGACARTGTRSCVNGSVSDSCTAGTAATNDATCNGIDDDCDGTADENYTASCSGSTAVRCVSGAVSETNCSDADTCNGAETCTGQAVCQPGTPPTLDDANPCTSDSCDPATGVAHTNVSNGITCGPGRICDGAGACIIEFAPPVITQQPVTQSVAVGAPFTFTVTATGPNLTYQWQRFGSNIAGATLASYSATAEYNDDGSAYRVVVSNPGGSVTSNTVNLTVADSVPPALSLDGSTDIQTALDAVTVRGTATDSGSGLDRVFVSSDRYGSQAFALAVGPTGAFQGEVPLRNGVNVLTVTALDLAGNRSERGLSATLLIGTVPVVRISAPASGTVVSAATIAVSGTVSSSLPPEEIRMRLGSALTFPTGSNGEYSFTFDGVRLSPGLNTLTVTAETVHGNGAAQTAVILQTTPDGGTLRPPEIQVVDVQPDMFVSSPVLPINGTVRAQTCVQSVAVNGASAIVTGTGANVSFGSVISITELDGAPFAIEIVARDCAGQESTLRFFVRYDNVAPILAVQGLSPDPSVNSFNETPARIRGVLNERNPAGLSVGSQSLGVVPGATAGTWNFEFDAPLVRGESSRLTIESWDHAGNRTQAAFVLRLDATVDIEILSPAEGTEYLGGQGAVSISALARIPGLASDDRVFARVDAGAPVLLTRGEDLARGTLVTSGAASDRTVVFEVKSSAGTTLATRSVRVKVVDPNSVPLALSSHSPANGAVNVEANEPLVLDFTRELTPELLEVSVVETVHGRVYEDLPPGADITAFADVKKVDLHRDSEPVPGGLSFLPGNRNVAFYPRRDYGYGGNVIVSVRYDGAEIGHFAFATRPMPTLVYGFVSDQALRPLEGVEVQLKEVGASTMTDSRGYFSFGFGTVADAIPGGRYRLEINPGWRNRNFSQSESWVNAQAGELTVAGLRRIQFLPQDLAMVPLRSGQPDVRLADGDLLLDLSDSAISFGDGSDAGNALSILVPGRAVPHRSLRHAIPSFGYLIQPGGLTATGTQTLTAALPTSEGGYDYLTGTPEWVLIVGLDPVALELVPVGVGRIDMTRHVVESRGILRLSRLDFIGFQLSSQPQQVLEAYANGQIGVGELNSAVGGAQQ